MRRYSDFIEAVPQKEVFALLKAADFFRIEDLMDLAAARLARQYLRKFSFAIASMPSASVSLLTQRRVEPVAEGADLLHRARVHP